MKSLSLLHFALGDRHARHRRSAILSDHLMRDIGLSGIPAGRRPARGRRAN